MKPLAKRQLEVLTLIAKGLTDKEISLKLGISTDTVNTHTSAIREKYGYGSRVTLVINGLKRGELQLGEL